MRDFRGWDANIVGEIHDIPFTSLRELYRDASSKQTLCAVFDSFGAPLQGRYDFLIPRSPGLCRVIEVWRREGKPRYRCHDTASGRAFKIDEKDFDAVVAWENKRRAARGVPPIEAQWAVDNVWQYYFLTPAGDVLATGETPYAHGSHPYVFKAYPFIDGEIHSFVSNVIDQQRYTNRLITMYDWIMRSSAKGVLLFPEECLPKGMTLDDVADEWARFNGVIMIKQPRSGTALPQQIANNSTNIGIHELLGMQLKFFEDISGVNGALQGKPGFSGMSARLYSQQAENATTSLLDILETFSAFVRDGAAKDVKNIQQFYDAPRVMNIAGRNAAVEYDPAKLRDIEFDLSITESTATPAYRIMANELLIELWQKQAISTRQMLKTPRDRPAANPGYS